MRKNITGNVCSNCAFREWWILENQNEKYVLYCTSELLLNLSKTDTVSRFFQIPGRTEELLDDPT